MATGNPTTVTDAFGEEYIFWTDALDVKFWTSLRSWTQTAFAQAVSDGPIDVTIDDTGLISVTYLGADGSRLAKASRRDGTSGTWSDRY